MKLLAFSWVTLKRESENSALDTIENKKTKERKNMKIRNKEEERNLMDVVLPAIFKTGGYFEEGREDVFCEHHFPFWPQYLRQANAKYFRGELSSEDFEIPLRKYYNLPPIAFKEKHYYNRERLSQ